MFSKLLYLFQYCSHREYFTLKNSLWNIINFIIFHITVLKYDIHLNKMSNYIIHSFYVVMASFAWLYINHECVTILEKYMYQADTIVGTYNYIQHPSQFHDIKWDRQINSKNILKFNLIQSDR